MYYSNKNKNDAEIYVVHKNAKTVEKSKLKHSTKYISSTGMTTSTMAEVNTQLK